MRTWNTLLYNLAFAANVLLLFFVLTEQWVVVPAWLQVAGRMHPLLLHFPIVLVLLCLVLEWLTVNRDLDRMLDWLWLATLNLTVFSALFGWILSREEGYDAAAVSWHKWGGVGISLFALIWYQVRRKIQQRKSLLAISSALMLGGLLITGHQGAVLTHGDDFLLAPVFGNAEKEQVAFKDAIVFDHVVMPILEAKCVSCHNTSKAKGELIMETAASLLKGGKTGLLWDTTAKEYGLLLQRAHLPLDHKEHMPPKGKPQLTDEELTILYQWIKTGGNMTVKLSELPDSDTLRLLTSSLFSNGKLENYTFAPASESAVEKLNSHYRLVQPIAAGSPALEVNYFGASQFKAAQLKDLLQIKEQLVSLNLNRMPVTDADLEILSQLTALRSLNLSFTSVTDKGLAYLQKLPGLRTLSVSGTAVTKDGLSKFPMPLEQLFCWNTGIEAEDVTALGSGWRNTAIETGFAGDTIQIQLNAPILENEESIFRKPFAVKLKHFVQGVDLRYTLDGSEPDSLTSPVYEPGLTISSSVLLKARAFKKGWISSSTVSRQFFNSGGKPDSVRLLTQPDPSYKGGGIALIDEVKGDGNFRSGRWLGYKGGDMAVLLHFNSPRVLKTISVSSIVDVGSYIMPPAEIQVWGADEKGNWTLMARETPRPLSKDTSQYEKIYTLALAEKPSKELKLVVKPISRLPAWHPGKGAPGWFFVDELFFE